MKRIGIVGQGNISGIYLSNIGHRFSNIVVAGTCDLIREKAESQAKVYGVPKIYRDMYELFADPDVDIVLNITRPNDHYGVTKAALLAGKHVYSEKPLATDLTLAKELVTLAKDRGLYLGGAPDTFMGAAIQTARKCIDEGMIGTPIGGMVHMLSRGCESWFRTRSSSIRKAAVQCLTWDLIIRRRLSICSAVRQKSQHSAEPLLQNEPSHLNHMPEKKSPWKSIHSLPVQSGLRTAPSSV